MLAPTVDVPVRLCANEMLRRKCNKYRTIADSSTARYGVSLVTIDQMSVFGQIRVTISARDHTANP